MAEPPAEGPSPRRADPAIEKDPATGSAMLPAPGREAPETGSPDKVVPAARTETKQALPSAPVPLSGYDPHSSNPPSVLPIPLEKIGSEEPQTTPKPTVLLTPTTQEPPQAAPLSSRQDSAPAAKTPLQQVAATTTVEQGQRPHTVGTGSSASTVRMVNSHRIMLDYDLADVPRPEQTELELWFTQDGKKWSKDQTVLRGGSPYLVEVNREGTYGFTLIARRPGDKSMGPKEGEAPQVWVEVDWTKPVVHMVHAVSKQSRQLDVAGIVTDNNLRVSRSRCRMPSARRGRSSRSRPPSRTPAVTSGRCRRTCPSGSSSASRRPTWWATPASARRRWSPLFADFEPRGASEGSPSPAPRAAKWEEYL